MDLTYKKFPHEIIDFKPKINKETKKVEIKGASVDTGSKAVSSTTGESNNSSGSGSASANGSSSSKSSSGGYTYDPTTKTWVKK